MKQEPKVKIWDKVWEWNVLGTDRKGKLKVIAKPTWVF